MPNKPAKRLSEAASKTSFSLDSPFLETLWPPISSHDQVVILDMLCSHLTAIGEHRSNRAKISTGRRDKKRKLGAAGASPAVAPPSSNGEIPVIESSRPAIASPITVGFNSTVRSLELCAQSSTPDPLKAGRGSLMLSHESLGSRGLVAVFVDRSTYPPILYSDLPVLVYTASLAFPEEPPIRLVTLPPGAHSKLSAALGVPRSSILGIRKAAPDVEPLVKFVRENVPPIDISWLRKAKGIYLPVKIKTTKTTTSSLKPRQ